VDVSQESRNLKAFFIRKLPENVVAQGAAAAGNQYLLPGHALRIQIFIRSLSSILAA
jgi:hypothetical protein